MFANGNYCTVWAVESKEKYSVVELSTSRKNQSGAYETDFSSKYVRFIGEANNRLKKHPLKTKDRIRLESVGVTTSNAKGKWYTNYLVFNYENVEPVGQNPVESRDVDEGFDEDECPF